MSNMINPFTDWGFKRIFGSEESKPVMIELLNAAIDDDHPIVDIIYRDKEQTPEEPDNRTVIYDIYCTTSDGRHIIVEMQYGRQSTFKERTLYYAARAINKQGASMGENYKIDEVVVVSILKKPNLKVSDKVRTVVMLTDIDSHKVFTDRLRLIYLQVSLAESMKREECVTDLDRLIFNLNNMEKLDELAFKDKNPVFVDMERLAQTIGLSDDEWAAYDRAIKRMKDYDAVMEGERAFAREEGLAEGRAEGRAEGMQQEKLAIATNLKKLGTPIDIIVQASGLTKEQVDAL